MRTSSIAVSLSCAILVNLSGCGSGPSGGQPAPEILSPTPAPHATPSGGTPAPGRPTSAPTILWAAGCGAEEVLSCDCKRPQSYCTRGVITRSEDLGHTWSQTYFDVALTSVDFSSPSNGWAVGVDGAAFRTTDGGSRWERIDLPLPDALNPEGSIVLTAVRFVDERRGSIAGWGGADQIGSWGPSPIFRSMVFALFTDDGGDSWHLAETNGRTVQGGDFYDDPQPGVSTSSMCFTDSGIGVITGDPVLLSRDAGKTWSEITDRVWPPGVGGLGVACRGEQSLWLAAGTHVAGSNDGGETWRLLNEPDALERNCCSAQIDFPTETSGWRGGEQLLRTVDGGRSWNVSDGSFPGIGVVDVRFVSPENGVWTSTTLAGVTDDGGDSWETVVIVPVDEGFYTIADVTVVD